MKAAVLVDSPSRREQVLMSNSRNATKTTLGDRAKEIVRGILETLEGIVAPPPALVPIPVRVRRPRR